MSQERKEIAVLFVVLALPALVFWGVTLEAVSAGSQVASLVAGTGALASTLGYISLAWRTRTRARARRRPLGEAPGAAADLAAVTIPRQSAAQRAPAIHRGP
jgi:protein-S-isoprenylcysteine O-methyltransferase Ste14